MKHEAEQQLLKTLNGQLNELPAVAKTMVQQYQLSAIVLSVICGVFLIAILAGTVWLSVYFFKKGEKQSSHERIWRTDCSAVSGMVAVTGGMISLIMLMSLVINIIHACAPIASLVNDLFS